MKGFSKRWQFVSVCVGLVILLTFKYFWSMYEFPGVPFGYDAGIYRYLFLTHARGFPPFLIAPMPEWAMGHPLGLFFFSSILLRLGLPVDHLIGWIWNLFPVILSCALALSLSKTYGKRIGCLTLLVSLVSIAQYEGFLMIYWKVFLALLWCTLAFSAYERKSRLWIVFGMFTVATHQQIGLLFGLATVSSILVSAMKQRRLKPELNNIGLFFLTGLLGLLWYLPNYSRSIGDILPMMLRPAVSLGVLAILCFGVLLLISIQISPLPRWWLMVVCIAVGFVLLLLPFIGYAPASVIDFLTKSRSTDPGAFLSVEEYLQSSAPLLILGIFGLGLFIRRNPQSPWIWAAVWSGLAVVSMFFFYRRFILPLDFFLIPSAVLALEWLWQHRFAWLRVLASAIVAVQAVFLLQNMAVIDPHVEAQSLEDFSKLAPVIVPHSQVVVLDNMAPWVVGFLPDAEVTGPGIFNSEPLEAWQKLLFGSHEDRLTFFQDYPKGTYFYATDVFRSFYPPEVQSLLEDSCLKPAGPQGLFVSSCGK